MFEDRNKYLKKHSLCIHFGHGYVPCESDYYCDRCQLGDRLRADRPEYMREQGIMLLYESDCLKPTPKGGGRDWYGKPILLKPETMKRLALPQTGVYQVAVACDGPGCFFENSVGAVDCRLFKDPTVRFTIGRHEAYGVPTMLACQKLDERFVWCLTQICYGKGGGAYDCARLIH